jgi:signal transduction histidine kinase
MKTMSRSTRSVRAGLYIGLTLTLSASVALGGAVSWLALNPGLHIVAAGIAAGALVCLFAGSVLLTSVARAGSAPAQPAVGPMAVPRPLGGEQAAAMAHAQKMEALGLLAGGVAHDFNNQLHVIRNSLELLQRQDPPAEALRALEMIRRSTNQAAALTRQLLAFSRRQPVEPRPIDPNDLVLQMADLLRYSLGERITIATTLGPGVWNVSADASQLETALLNLAINARDAMSHAGLLTIETANATLDDSLAAAAAGRPGATGQYVMISVADTGSGMTPEVAARACEPFFTTKEPGHGTGLGLSQVAGFARQFGGEVRISTQPGKGTTVRIYLPSSRRAGESARGVARPAKRPAWPMEAHKGVALAMGAGAER